MTHDRRNGGARPQRTRLGWLIPGLGVVAAIYLGLNALAFGAVVATRGSGAAATLTAKLAVASSPGAALLLLASFAPLGLGAWAAGRWVHRAALRDLAGPRRDVLNGAARGAAAVLAVYLPALGVWHLVYDSQPYLPVSVWLGLLPVTLLAVGLQTFAEELVFRGYLQGRLLAAGLGKAVAIMGPALVFGLLHHDPTTPPATAWAVVAAAAVFGIMAADLTLRSGNIGLAWGAHFANNVMALAVLGTQGTITGLALRVTPYSLDGMAHPAALFADLVPMALIWVWLRRGIAR